MQISTGQPVDERTRQLERIVDQLETFIAEQFARWETVVEAANQVVAMKDRARRLLQEVEVEKECWESEQAERIAVLENESVLLADAWKRLEGEERRLVAKEAIAENACAGMATPTPVDLKQQIAAAQKSVEAEQAAAGEMDDLESRIAAIQEFRQLSIEIAKHASRNR